MLSRRSISRPRKPIAAASPSMWPPPITDHSINGLTDHIRCARVRAAGSDRSSQSRASATARKASAFSTLSQKIVFAVDGPARTDAACSENVPIGP